MARVMFWVAILALACSCVIPVVRATLTEEEQAELLKAHNHYRGLVDPIATNMLRVVSAFADNAQILSCWFAYTCISMSMYIHRASSPLFIFRNGMTSLPMRLNSGQPAVSICSTRIATTKSKPTTTSDKAMAQP